MAKSVIPTMPTTAKRRRSRAAKRTRDVTLHSPYQEKRCGGAWYVRRVDHATGKRESIRLPGAVNVSTALTEVDRLYHEQLDRECAPGTGTGTAGGPPGTTRIEDALIAWLELKRPHLRPSTARDLESCCKLYATAFTAAPPDGLDLQHVNDIGLQHVETLLLKKWKRLTGRTLLKHLGYLRAFLRWCADHEYADGNPAERFRPPPTWNAAVRASRDTGQALNHAQAVQLLHACRERTQQVVRARSGAREGASWVQTWTPPEHLFSAVLIGLRAGLRLANITGLRWRNVDLTAGTLTIEGDQMKNRRRFHVPLHPELHAHLREVLRRQTASQGHAPKPDDRVLDLAGEKSRQFTKAFKAALKRAGLPAIRVHDLRHSYSVMLAEHLPYAVLQLLLGHTASSVTDRYTMKIGIDVLREHLERLPWFFPAAPAQALPADGAAK